jgi:hypothetical protein
MRTKRLLLATTALSTMTLASGCGKERIHGNPKGSFYDDAAVQPLPANPKGSFYDDGMAPKPTATASATAIATDGPPPPPSATAAATTPKPSATVGPVVPRMPANPKGSHYDKGPPKPPPPPAKE